MHMKQARTLNKISCNVNAGVMTGGLITGAGKYLRERDSSIQIVAVEPKESAVLSGDRPGPHGLQVLPNKLVMTFVDVSLLRFDLTCMQWRIHSRR